MNSKIKRTWELLGYPKDSLTKFKATDGHSIEEMKELWPFTSTTWGQFEEEYLYNNLYNEQLKKEVEERVDKEWREANGI